MQSRTALAVLCCVLVAASSCGMRPCVYLAPSGQTAAVAQWNCMFGACGMLFGWCLAVSAMELRTLSKALMTMADATRHTVRSPYAHTNAMSVVNDDGAAESNEDAAMMDREQFQAAAGAGQSRGLRSASFQ